MKTKTKKSQSSSEKKTAIIVDTQVAWKNLKLLNGESFLMKLKPSFLGYEYIIENNLSGDITILPASEKGVPLNWKVLSKQFIEDEGYEIK